MTTDEPGDRLYGTNCNGLVIIFISFALQIKLKTLAGVAEGARVHNWRETMTLDMTVTSAESERNERSCAP